MLVDHASRMSVRPQRHLFSSLVQLVVLVLRNREDSSRFPAAGCSNDGIINRTRIGHIVASIAIFLGFTIRARQRSVLLPLEEYARER